MKLAVLGLVLGATVLGALPASAQVVVREHDHRDNVVVREHVDRGHHYGWRRHYADCRVVKVRTELPNGKIIFKTRRTCD